MTDFNEKSEKHYWIDPGMGKKMPGCPYSTYEDGHDVQEYIIPPKGYVLVCFKFDPDASNQIYDGKLVAEYAKEPFKTRLKSNLWKLVLILGIVLIIGIVILLATSVFKGPKPNHSAKKVKPKTEIKKDAKPEKTPSNTTKEEVNKAEEIAQSEPEEQPKVVENKEIQQTVVSDPNEAFKKAFWNLVHEKNPSMDAFTDLYNENKAKVSGEEFDYLRFTILKDYVSFKGWFDKLKSIPDNQLQSINTVNALKNNINYNP